VAAEGEVLDDGREDVQEMVSVDLVQVAIRPLPRTVT
jgi:hypothetical protein